MSKKRYFGSPIQRGQLQAEAPRPSSAAALIETSPREETCVASSNLSPTEYWNMPDESRRVLYYPASSRTEACGLTTLWRMNYKTDNTEVTSCSSFTQNTSWLGCGIPYYYHQIEDKWMNGGKNLTLKKYSQLSSYIKGKVDAWWAEFEEAILGKSLGFPHHDDSVGPGQLRFKPDTKTDARYTSSGAIFISDIEIQARFPYSDKSADREWKFTEMLAKWWYLSQLGGQDLEQKKMVSYTPTMMLLPWNRLGSRLTSVGQSGFARTSIIMQQDEVYTQLISLNAHAQDVAFLDYWEGLEAGEPWVQDAFAIYDQIYSPLYDTLSSSKANRLTSSGIKEEWERILGYGRYNGQPKWKYLQEKYAWRKQGKFRIQLFDEMCVYRPNTTRLLLSATGTPQAKVDEVRNYYKNRIGSYTLSNLPKEKFYEVFQAKLDLQRAKAEKAVALSIFQKWYKEYLHYEQLGDYDKLLELQQQDLTGTIDQERVDELTAAMGDIETEETLNVLPWVILGVSAIGLGGAYWWMNKKQKGGT